ncbi:MFS transporter [Conexibacter woesei]|uniref:Major facilitator superfamily MFS_1 n=1 Tax=Conexibacter woesei (strain DSM 14684 / CCUG 47730 / CIP 108061 / JCM 11494 / NBRC 100937 / ID131577) TaxID=469383 RepID=D3F8Z8_CONWI|nr:major facilitator superfamily MFS_1 [Conexibacter woesei DSM 14684]
MQMHVLYPAMTALASPPEAPRESEASQAQHWDARLWGALFVLCGALFLDGLDVSMVGVALPSIGADLGLSTGDLQWVVSGYVLGYGGLLLLGGRTADILGRRSVFLAAVAVFAVASLLGGIASDGGVLIATRFIKGVAAAFTVPAGLSIVTTTFAEGPARNRALSIYAACGATGFSAGLIFGGLLTEIGWRWTFIVPGPIALLVLLAGIRLIPRDKVDPAERQGFDLLGAISVSAAMLLLVRTVVTAPEVGWGAGEVLGGFAISAALMITFVLIERRVKHPLVRLGILRSGSLVRANLAAVAVFGSYVAFQFIATLYLQNLLEWSALQTALAFLPAGLLVATVAPRIGKVADRIGTAPILVVGFVAFVSGYLLFMRIDASPTYIVDILPTMLLLGIGFAFCFPALNMQATAGVADHEQGLASGLVNTSFQVGGAVVLAIAAAIVTSQAGVSTDPQTLLDAYRPALGVVAGISAAGLLVSLSGVLVRQRQSAVAVASADES